MLENVDEYVFSVCLFSVILQEIRLKISNTAQQSDVNNVMQQPCIYLMRALQEGEVGRNMYKQLIIHEPVRYAVCLQICWLVHCVSKHTNLHF